MVTTIQATSIIPEREFISTAITYNAYGMKPNTIHKLYILDFDISSVCTPKNGMLGDQIITDEQGQCEFTFHLDQAANVSAGNRDRRSMWHLIETEIYVRSSPRRGAAGFSPNMMIFESVLKNAAGDSTARGTFRFVEIGRREFVDGRLVIGRDYGTGEGAGAGGYIFEPPYDGGTING